MLRKKLLGFFAFSGVLAIALLLASCQAKASGPKIQVHILETSDVHTNIMDYNYYQSKTDPTIGLVRAAALAKQLRAQYKNAIMVDDGDFLQGAPMGNWTHADLMKSGQPSPIVTAMNLMNYDVVNVGNHEFNYGLNFLFASLKNAKFPIISANAVYVTGKQMGDSSFPASSNKAPYKSGQTLFAPYLIKSYSFTAEDGSTQSVKVAFIGVLPPQIMSWDHKNLAGILETKDEAKTVAKYVPIVQSKGADVVVVLLHGGISDQSAKPGKTMVENDAYGVSRVSGVDALMLGHTHAVFPGDYANMPGVDNVKGTINGIPAVMPGRFGDHVGDVSLTLQKKGGKWTVVDGSGVAHPIYDKKAKKALVEPDSEMVSALASAHKATMAYMDQPIGKLSQKVNSFLALVQDSASLQLINDAQISYVKSLPMFQKAPYKGLPIISAAAPFRTGGRHNAPDNFTDVPSVVTQRGLADLYVYNNSVAVLKITGAQLREWLEMSAGLYNQIDPTKTGAQQLIDPTFRTYNFDVVDGVQYKIDVTKPARYTADARRTQSSAHRIVDLTYNGKPVTGDQTFLMASNDYRAFGGKFSGTGSDKVLYLSPDTARTILGRYIQATTASAGVVNIKADMNWSIAKITSGAPDLEVFTSNQPDVKAYVSASAQHPMSFVRADEVGFSIYKITL